MLGWPALAVQFGFQLADSFLGRLAGLCFGLTCMGFRVGADALGVGAVRSAWARASACWRACTTS